MLFYDSCKGACLQWLFSCGACSAILQPHGPSRLLCPWDFPGKNTGMGCHFLSQGVFLCWQVVSLPLSHLGSQLMHSKYLIHVSRMILSSQDMETNFVSADGLMDKENMIYLYIIVLIKKILPLATVWLNLEDNLLYE